MPPVATQRRDRPSVGATLRRDRRCHRYPPTPTDAHRSNLTYNRKTEKDLPHEHLVRPIGRRTRHRGHR